MESEIPVYQVPIGRYIVATHYGNSLPLGNYACIQAIPEKTPKNKVKHWKTVGFLLFWQESRWNQKYYNYYI